MSSPNPFSEPEQRELLEIARTALGTFFREQRLLPVKPRSPRLSEPAGAFVTLERGGSLRGCIGHLAADRPLSLTVQEMAVQAATGDPRFSPVTPDELSRIDIEISVLSPMRRIADPAEIRIGADGLFISQGMRRGVLLPQVAVREHWDGPTFLEMTCLKAGLPRGAWREAEVSVFSAQVFGERDTGKR